MLSSTILTMPPEARAALGPTALALTPDSQRLLIACAVAKEVLGYDIPKKTISWRVAVPEPPLGMALSKDATQLYVTCSAASSVVCLLDTETAKITARVPAGHTAMAPVLSPDGLKLYVCNRFDNDVSIIDTAAKRQLRRIPVEREPIAAALTPDGKKLVVANHLHAGPANTIRAGARISLIDTETGKAKSIELSEGCGLLRGVAISPDGRFAAVTHLRSMYWLTTTTVEFGGMNGNALSFLDLEREDFLGTLLVDQTTRGAANPWALSWLSDGRTVAVTHAGTHELSLVDAPANADPSNFTSMRLRNYENGGRPIPAEARHPVRVQRRISLPGNGPRAFAVTASAVYVANYFSDDLCRIDLEDLEQPVERLPLGAAIEDSPIREGEKWFNDASLCFQGWQSCASCHDADGRADALNWDLLNDGIGNPKNTKSLLRSRDTAPAMALGVRPSSEAAVRAGMRHILFTNAAEVTATAIDAWLNSLEPIPSPRTHNGKLSPSAERGKLIFMSPETGCAQCHPPPLFTDRAAYDVGTACAYQGMWDKAVADSPDQRFDTPALLELWRSAPYLHDGSAANLREVVTSRNLKDQHGTTSHLSTAQVEDLLEYLLSL